MTTVKTLDTATDLAVLTRALVFSADKHRNQRRKDASASPYINHPIDVLNVLVQAGICDTATLAGAVLHDTIEDTKTTFDEIQELFGPEIARIVQEVSDDKTLPKEERKRLQIVHASEISLQARLVKVADKTSNLLDIARCPPTEWTLTRRQKYFDWALEVVKATGGPDAALLDSFHKAFLLRPTSR